MYFCETKAVMNDLADIFDDISVTTKIAELVLS